MSFSEYKILFIEDDILTKNEDNEFYSLIEKYFGEKKITFSLLEMVLLKERGIGETYIFAKKVFDAKEFYDKYCALVEKFKADFEGGVSSFEEWYIQNTWIYIGTGTKNKALYNLQDYIWNGSFDAREIKNYGQRKGLTKDFILDYFNNYAEEICKLELGKHPHFFIIIQPIGNRHNKKIFPLGNLYLHFGTIEKVEINDIQNFLLEFIIIWCKCYGGTKYKHLIDKLVAKVLSNEKVAPFLPGYLGVHDDEMKIVFTYYFSNNENLSNFEKRVEEFKNVLRVIKGQKIDENNKVIRQYKDRPITFKHLLITFDDLKFENFIFARALALFLFLVNNLSVEETQTILVKYKSEKNDSDSKFSYIYSNLHIWFPKTKGQAESRRTIIKAIYKEPLNKRETKMISKLMKSLSLFETSLIKEFL